MELSELTSYAGERYQIQEQHKWADFPGFSVLCHPQTGKWIALLMRQWDTETGTQIERCDLKCGREELLGLSKPFLSPPVRMRGNKWIGIIFDRTTERDVVFQLFDRAVANGKEHGYTFVLGSQFPSGEGTYQETLLPPPGSAVRDNKESIPDRLREMRRLYEYGRESDEARAKNFYRQALFMRDYEDDCPWTGEDFVRYFPTYHDLTIRQLRGYFTWRTHLRRGEFQPIPASAAYLYVYELLNGIGTASPEETLQKLQEFEHGFLDSGIGDTRMRSNLHRWMLDFAVLHDLPVALARQAADPDMMEWDRALTALMSPENHTDREVFSALCRLGGKKTENTPVLKDDPERGIHLFSEVWRAALSYCWQGKNLFTLCFGEKQTRRWYPLANAVWYRRTRQEDRDYELNECRRFICRNGSWKSESYEKPGWDRERMQGFLHETDARLRRYLKTGRYLKESTKDEWVIPYIDSVIAADRKAGIEAARPEIRIDLSGLDQIRRDALATQNSLMIEEDPEVYDAEVENAVPTVPENMTADIPLDELQIQLLRALLAGRDAAGIIRENHLMPSVVADSINEALFDEFGDTVLLCEGEGLFLVDDYLEDLEQYLGGTGNG